MLHMNTPHVKKLRVTVPVTPEVLALFKRLSDVSGKSVGRLMGEWLDETRDGLEPMIEIMVNFKTAPKAAVQALQLHASALTEMAADVVRDAMFLDPDAAANGGQQAKRDAGRGASGFRGKRGLTPPSSNTGGKATTNPLNRDRDSK